MATRVVLQRDHLYCGVHRRGSVTLVFPGMVGDIAIVKRSTDGTGKHWTVAWRMSNKDRRVLLDKDTSEEEAVTMAENRLRAFTNLCCKLDGPVCAWFFDNGKQARSLKSRFKDLLTYPVTQHDTYLHMEVGGRLGDRAIAKQYNGHELHVLKNKQI